MVSMSTIDSKNIIDELIAKNGYYYDDPRVYMIVEYVNAGGNITWGITYVNEREKLRYLNGEPPYINKPKVIWKSV